MMKFRSIEKSCWLLISLFFLVVLNCRTVLGFCCPPEVPVLKGFAVRFSKRYCVVRQAVKDPVDNPKSATVRFTSPTTTVSSNANLIDKALSWITSDIGSIVLGGIGLILLLVGRLVLDSSINQVDFEVTGAQTRANLLAVFAVGAVLLNGLSQLDVQSVLAEKVDLVGSVIVNPIVRSTNAIFVEKESVSWVLSSIISATPANTAILLIYSEEKKWKVLAHVGVVPPNVLLDDPKLPDETPIMNRLLRLPTSNSERRESYLPTLQALPGRTEFTNHLLPPNTQAALLLPITLSGPTAFSAALLLGSNQARSFTPRDIAWCLTAVTRLEL